MSLTSGSLDEFEKQPRGSLVHHRLFIGQDMFFRRWRVRARSAVAGLSSPSPITHHPTSLIASHTTRRLNVCTVCYPSCRCIFFVRMRVRVSKNNDSTINSIVKGKVQFYSIVKDSWFLSHPFSRVLVVAFAFALSPTQHVGSGDT